MNGRNTRLGLNLIRRWAAQGAALLSPRCNPITGTSPAGGIPSKVGAGIILFNSYGVGFGSCFHFLQTFDSYGVERSLPEAQSNRNPMSPYLSYGVGSLIAKLRGSFTFVANHFSYQAELRRSSTIVDQKIFAKLKNISILLNLLRYNESER